MSCLCFYVDRNKDHFIWTASIVLSLFSGEVWEELCLLPSRWKLTIKSQREDTCMHAATHFLSLIMWKTGMFISTHQQIPKGPWRHNGLLSSVGNSVRLLFPLNEQDRCKSWACGQEVEPILEHRYPAGANRGEERRSRGVLEDERIQ